MTNCNCAGNCSAIGIGESAQIVPIPKPFGVVLIPHNHRALLMFFFRFRILIGFLLCSSTESRHWRDFFWLFLILRVEISAIFCTTTFQIKSVESCGMGIVFIGAHREGGIRKARHKFSSSSSFFRSFFPNLPEHFCQLFPDITAPIPGKMILLKNPLHPSLASFYLFSACQNRTRGADFWIDGNQCGAPQKSGKKRLGVIIIICKLAAPRVPLESETQKQPWWS